MQLTDTKQAKPSSDFVNNERSERRIHLLNLRGRRYLVYRGKHGPTEILGVVVRGGGNASDVKPHQEADPGKGESTLITHSKKHLIFIQVPEREAASVLSFSNCRHEFFGRQK